MHIYGSPYKDIAVVGWSKDGQEEGTPVWDKMPSPSSAQLVSFRQAVPGTQYIEQREASSGLVANG